MLRSFIAAAASVFVISVAAAAQTTTEPPASNTLPVSFFTSYRFHFDGESLHQDDPRFRWQAHFGGDFDLIDYTKGRFNFLTDYEAIMGNQLRTFDPNQGNYTLDLSTSYRHPTAEYAFVFHHVSNHLHDRP